MSAAKPIAGLDEKIRTLHRYSACDVSDALLKLQTTAPGKIARAGHLADIAPVVLPPTAGDDAESHQKVIAPASTLKLVSKHSQLASVAPAHGAVPSGSHWVDLTEPGTVVVIDQPEGQKCAAVGGIMAQRMKIRGVAGCVVGGRVRDLTELRHCELPIFALGRSTVGTNAESMVYARDLDVSITGIVVSPGDIVFCDPVEGVVVIPKQLLDPVLALMPKLTAADDRVKEAIAGGMTVAEAFKTFRR